MQMMLYNEHEHEEVEKGGLKKKEEKGKHEKE